MTLGAVAGSARRTAPASGTHITDDFNRANASTLGASWTSRFGTFGIISNTAYDSSAFIASSSHNTTMTADDMSAQWTVGALAGSGSDTTGMIIGANAAGEAAMGYWTGGSVYIYTVTSWVLGGATARVGGSQTISPGDVLKVSRVGNVYTLYTNGVSGLTWTDSTNIVPRDSSHRYVGMISSFNSNVNYRMIDSFAADSA